MKKHSDSIIGLILPLSALSLGGGICWVLNGLGKGEGIIQTFLIAGILVILGISGLIFCSIWHTGVYKQ